MFKLLEKTLFSVALWMFLLFGAIDVSAVTLDATIPIIDTVQQPTTKVVGLRRPASQSVE